MQGKGCAPTLMWRLLHPRRVGDLSHTELLGHSQSQTGWLAQRACTASTSLIPWGSPGCTPQPCCGVWSALGCPHKQIPVLGNGQTWALLGWEEFPWGNVFL